MLANRRRQVELHSQSPDYTGIMISFLAGKNQHKTKQKKQNNGQRFGLRSRATNRTRAGQHPIPAGLPTSVNLSACQLYVRVDVDVDVMLSMRWFLHRSHAICNRRQIELKDFLIRHILFLYQSI